MNTHQPNPSHQIAGCRSLGILLGTLAAIAWMISVPELAMAQASRPIRVQFLGDNGHHRPEDLFRALQGPMSQVGIELEYTQDLDQAFDPKRLATFDALLVYANIEKLPKKAEDVLMDYVADGKALIALHCATYCFLNSDRYVELVGGQFKEHGGERFATHIVAPKHPIMNGFGGFESWDETYIHHRHNTQDRIVLEERREGKLAADGQPEPWTWVRTHGKGRVFYTAWGHNMDTWSQVGYHNLVERGIRWATHNDVSKAAPFVGLNRFPTPEMTTLAKDLPPFTYTEVGDKIPNYTPSKNWGTQGKPITTMQNPLPPQESLQHYVTPKDFQMKLWATEQDVAKGASEYAGLAGKPLAMNWDHRGRLWLCESIDYPNELQPPGKGRDRIRICEDTDHNGTADKFTVFATNLSIPTAIVCYRDGALVQDGQTTIYLKDTNGDDVADFRQELITGWAIGDTHGGVSNFQYGLDNWIWGMQGYNDSHPVINGEKQQGFRQGFWRFAVEPAPSSETAPVYKLDQGVAQSKRSSEFDTHAIRVSKLEFIRSTDNNTWGLGISEEGLIFGSTANGNPSDFMPIPNRYYERVNGWSPATLHSIADSDKFRAVTPNVRQVDHHGGYTAAAGHALYTARRYPSSWWNRLSFVCEPTGHLIGTFVLDRNGAGYRSTSPFNLIASDDEWASPTMAEVGPDGNMWIIDWYNFIVQHNPTPQGFKTGKGAAYESDLRDKKHARIYRVVYTGKEGLDSATLDKADALVRKGLNRNDEGSLVAALSHPTMLWRKTAQRLMVEKGSLTPATISRLQSLANDPATEANGLNVGAIHALWVLHALQSNGSTAEANTNALSHRSPGVRRNAIIVAPNTVASLRAIAKAGCFEDADLQVRLAALLKASDCSESNSELAGLLAQPDRLVFDPTRSNAPPDRWLLDAWTSAAAIHSEALLPKLLTSRSTSNDASLAGAVSIVAQHAARARLTPRAFEALLVTPTSNEMGAAVIGGLVAGWPKEYGLALSESGRKQLLDHWLNGPLPIEVKGQVVQLAQACKIDDLGQGFTQILAGLKNVYEDVALDDGARVAAAQQAVVLQSKNTQLVSDLLDLITPQSSPDFSNALLSALKNSRSDQLASLLIDRSGKLPPNFRTGVIRLLLVRPETTNDLLDAIHSHQLAMSDLQLDQRQALRDHPDPKVRERALELMKNSGGIPNADRQKVLDAWMAITQEEGNVDAGKLMFVKHCALCHQHGDLGVTIGPNLTGMAVHPKAELLMNILDPSRSVEGNFKAYIVSTSGGSVITGMLAGESKTSIEIINTQGKREVILREDIEELKVSQKSLMPEGFEGQMTKTEMRDLLQFLANKGKYVPIPIDSAATVVTTQGMFFDHNNTVERLIFPDWKPKMFRDVPFVLIDPQGDRVPNAIMLNGPNGNYAPKMPKQVEITCEAPAVAIHFLGGIGGWSFPASPEGSTSVTVRLTFANGETEDHGLVNGQHLADYIRHVDVPKSEFAFDLEGRQVRYFAIEPKIREPLKKIELIKGRDASAPVFFAITVQTQ